MDVSTPVGKLITTLKQQLKAKHLSYRQVATRLKVSEATVKRYLNGKGVTLDVLQSLAEVVDLDLLTLVILAQQPGAIQQGLNKAQEAVLKRRGPLGSVYFLLRTGWSVPQIEREFGLGLKLESVLSRLEALGLIRRLAKQGVKILASPNIAEHAYGQMSDLAYETTQQFLADLDLRDESCDWRFDSARLSQASARLLRKRFKEIETEMRSLTKNDLGLPPEETQWYRLFWASRPASRKDLLRDL